MTKNRPESAIDIDFNLCFTKTELNYKQNNESQAKWRLGDNIDCNFKIANYNTLKWSNYKKSLYR